MAEAAAMGVTCAAQELRITIDFGQFALHAYHGPGCPAFTKSRLS